MASLWILQSQFRAVTLCYDAQYAENIASAHANPKSNLRLANLASALRRTVHAVCSCVYFQHVKSHRRLPWNEMADGVCDQTSRRDMGFAIEPFPAVIRAVIAGAYGCPQWLHLHAESSSRLAEFPPLNNDGMFLPWQGIKDGCRALPDEVIVAAVDRDDGAASGVTPSHLPDGVHVVSYNAQSLRGDLREDGPDGKKKGRRRLKKGSQKRAAAKQPICVNGSSKLSMVLYQVATRKGHIAGFQEMRAFKTGICIVTLWYAGVRPTNFQHMDADLPSI